MKGVNRFFGIGNLGKDPEIRATPNGTVVASFSLGINERMKIKDQWQDVTTWLNCVAFGRTAEVIRDYTQKGPPLFIEGRIQVRSYDDKQGQKRYVTEILVNEVTLLNSAAAKPNQHGQRITDDDLPDNLRDDSIPF